MRNSLLASFLVIAIIFSFINATAQTSSISFDGNTGHLDLGNLYNFDTNDVFTVEAWIMTTASTGIHQIISKLDVNATGWGFQLEDNKLMLYSIADFPNNNSQWIIQQTNLADGDWHHVAGVFGGIGNGALYVDGSLVTITTQETLSKSFITTAPTIIGAYPIQGTIYEPWNGKLDEIRIWDDIRTASEILENMDCALSGTEPNLVGYWDLEEGTGTTTTDKAQNVTGNLASGASWNSDKPINCAVGLAETYSVNRIEISPNPFSNRTLIQSNTNLNNAHLTLYNMQGKKVKEMPPQWSHSFNRTR